MKKGLLTKILTLGLVIAVTATATVAGTLAYLTDKEDPQKNVFSVGNVDITLKEETSVVGGGSSTSDENGAKYINVVPGDKLQKKVTIKNDGTNPAYVMATVTLNNAKEINNAIDVFYEAKYDDNATEVQEMYDYIFEGWHINYSPRPGAAGLDDSRGVIDGTFGLPEHVLKVDFEKTTDYDNDTTMFGLTNWFMTEQEKAAAAKGSRSLFMENGGFYTRNLNDDPSTSEDERDYRIIYTYYIFLEPGEDTVLFEGLNVPAEFNSAQLSMFDGLEINVEASAIQADNLTAEAAFTLLHKKYAEEVHDVTFVYSQKEFDEAIKNEKTVIVLDSSETGEEFTIPSGAQGKTLTLIGANENAGATINVKPAGRGEANGQLDYSLDGSTVYFSNLTIKTNSELYAGYARLNGIYNDCVIQNTYNLGVGTSEFNNCTFNITNEYMRVNGAYSAVFNNCTFNTDGRAILVFQDGTKHSPQKVTVKDCTFNATAPAKTWNGIHVSAVSIDGTQGTYIVNLEGNNVVDSDFNGFWQIKTGDTNVVVNENYTLSTPASTADELIQALENNEDVVLTNSIKIDPASMSNAYGTTGINIKNGQSLDGNDYTIDIKGAGGTWDSGINTTGGTIKNVKVTGSFRGIFVNHNSSHSERVILENVTIDGTVYTISCDQGTNQGLTATDSTFNGWTSYAETLGDAKFVDCSFGEGNGYAYMRPYAPTEFVNCEFEAGFEMDAIAAVTFENCYLDGVLITTDNLSTLVTSNTSNASVK